MKITQVRDFAARHRNNPPPTGEADHPQVWGGAPAPLAPEDAETGMAEMNKVYNDTGRELYMGAGGRELYIGQGNREQD